MITTIATLALLSPAQLATPVPEQAITAALAGQNADEGFTNGSLRGTQSWLNGGFTIDDWNSD